MVDIFIMRLSLWKSIHMSMRGKLILIKSVLNSISIYTWYVQLLLVGVHNSLHSLMSKFLCGGSNSTRKLHLVD